MYDKIYIKNYAGDIGVPELMSADKRLLGI